MFLHACMCMFVALVLKNKGKVKNYLLPVNLFFNSSTCHQSIYNNIFHLTNSICTINTLIIRTVKAKRKKKNYSALQAKKVNISIKEGLKLQTIRKKHNRSGNQHT